MSSRSAADPSLTEYSSTAAAELPAQPVAEQEESSFQTLALGWVALASLARLACVAALPLGNGEAYYASWSRFLSLSYYDHPPLIAWMTWLTTRLGNAAVAVRLGPILCSAAFGLLFYRLATRFVRPRAAFLGLVLLTALPVFLVSSFVLNPEAPLAPLWVAALLALDDLRTHDESWRPLVAGALIGFAFLAKYTGLLLVPAALVYLVLSPQSRRWLSRPTLYLGGVVALIVALPVVVWNQLHGWASLALHFVERNQAAAPVPGENPFNDLVASASASGPSLLGSIGHVLGGQFFSYSPFLSPLLVIGLVQILRRARRDDGELFLAVMGSVPLFLLLTALVKVKDSEQHWTMMALVPAAIAAGRFVDGFWESSRFLRGWFRTGLAVTGVLFVVANLHAHTSAVLRLIPADRYDAHADIANELVGWDTVRSELGRVVQSTPGPVVLASNHYSLCGKLMFETADAPPVYCPTTRRTEFDFMDRRHPPADATVIALISDIHKELPAELAPRHCTKADTMTITRAGIGVAHYDVYSCPPASAAGSAPVAEHS